MKTERQQSGSLHWHGSALEWEGEGRDMARTAFGVYSLARSYIREGATRTTEWEVRIIGRLALVGIGGTKTEARKIAQRDYERMGQASYVKNN